MPRKATTKKTEKKTETKTRTKPTTKRSTKKAVEEVVEEETVSDVEQDVGDSKQVVEETTTSTPSKRVAPTKESVLQGFDDLLATVEEEIARLRESQTKTKGVKYLRSLGKRVKTLRSQSSRVMKQKKRTVRKNNNNSGFLKPVNISKEMCKFTGWKAGEKKSRVDVTKHICNYIKEHDLQNPKDKRQILADPKLSKLLGYDSKKESEPLTYYRIQSFMKPHFLKDEA